MSVVGWKGTKSCGCVVWLYSGYGDTQKQKEHTIAKAIDRGLTVEAITEADEDGAREAWGPCAHQENVPDALLAAKALVEEAL